MQEMDAQPLVLKKQVIPVLELILHKVHVLRTKYVVTQLSQLLPANSVTMETQIQVMVVMQLVREKLAGLVQTLLMPRVLVQQLVVMEQELMVKKPVMTETLIQEMDVQPLVLKRQVLLVQELILQQVHVLNNEQSFPIYMKLIN